MRTTFVVAALLVGLVLVGGVAAEQPGTQFEGDRATFTAVDDGNETNETDESDGFGSSVSSFVQSTTAETNTAVDQGIWEASVEGNATADQAQDRAAKLGERIAELRAQRARLAERRANGSISLQTYVARDAGLRAELRSLGAAANETKRVAPADPTVQESLTRVAQAADAAQGPPNEVVNRSGVPSDVPGVGNGSQPENVSNGEGPPGNATDNAPGDNGNAPGDNGNAPNGTGNGSGGAGNGADGADGSDGSGSGADSGGSGSDDAGSSGSGSDSGSSAGSEGTDTSSGTDDSDDTTDGSGSKGSSDNGSSGSNGSGMRSQPESTGETGPEND